MVFGDGSPPTPEVGRREHPFSHLRGRRRPAPAKGRGKDEVFSRTFASNASMNSELQSGPAVMKPYLPDLRRGALLSQGEEG